MRTFDPELNTVGLTNEYVLYTARHTFGTSLTKNLALVMSVIGHTGVKTAMRYQHPELEAARAAIEQRRREMASVLGLAPSLEQVRLWNAHGQ